MKRIAHHNPWLKPLTFLYGVGVKMRNFCFDNNWIKQTSYEIPVICVGNITVGGTGKTPHVEYLIELLQEDYRIAVLSRGYKRTTKGLLEASLDATVSDIGDEPKQLKQKYPHVRVIVDANRRRAMASLLSEPIESRPQVVILDDGFQHRYIKPSFTLLLTDFNRPMVKDCLLPEGELREPMKAILRADCVVITKCPNNMQPINKRMAERDLALYPHQKVFFTSMEYGHATNIFDKSQTLQTLPTEILLLTGIASPETLIKYLQEGECVIHDHINLEDHHNFEHQELVEIDKKISQFKQQYPKGLFLTTEKDAMRIAEFADCFSPEVRESMFYIPIKIKILYNSDCIFAKMIAKAASKGKTL